MATWLYAAAARCPDRLALEGPGRSLTYAQLACEAAAVAARLGAPRRVAIAMAPGEDVVVALHACMLAGAAIVPVDLRHSPAERAQRLAGADLVLEELPETSSPEEARPETSSPARSSRPERGGARAWPEAPAPGPEATLAVMHTSGTTAVPKPVPLTYANFLASALGSAVALGLDHRERWLCPMPLTHVGGLSIPIRSSIYATTVVLHRSFDTERVLAELMDAGRAITLASLVPTMLGRLLDAGLRQPPTLRWALLGGGPIAPALLERARDAGVPVAPTYGMTEACSQIATFGWPLPGVDVRLAQDEIHVRGPIVSPGALDPDGWLHTGDLGRFDDRGRLEIVGRKSDTIVTGGENVAPTEVEAVLLEHPGVTDAGVFATADPEWGEAVTAAVVFRDGVHVPAEELRAFCAGRLARFKVPKAIREVDRLPRTASGKLIRRQLAGPAVGDPRPWPC